MATTSPAPEQSLSPTLTAWEVIPAWRFTAMYAVLLLCIPTRLIVGPIGAPGTPANLFAMVGLVWWICSIAGGLNPRRGITPTRLSFGLFTAAVLISYAAGQIQGWYQPADIHQRSDRLWQAANVAQVTETIGSAADRGLLAWAGWAGIVLLTAEGIRSWRELEKVISWVVGAGTFMATIGVIQYFTRWNIAGLLQIPGLTALTDFGNALSRSTLNRIVSTSAHPIELGVVMATILPLALHRSLHSDRKSTWIPTLLIGLAALMSVSRSAIVVAAVALVILFLGWPMRWRLIALALVPVAGVLGPIALPGLLGTLRSLFTGIEHDPSITGRTDDYELVFRMFSERPLFGQGLFTWVPMVYRTIDNQALVLLLELGIVGLAAFAWLILSGLIQALAPLRTGGSAQQRHLGLAVAAALIGITTSYVTFDAMGFRQVAGLTFLMLGLAGAVWHISQDSRDAGLAVLPVPTPAQPRRRLAEAFQRGDRVPPQSVHQ